MNSARLTAAALLLACLAATAQTSDPQFQTRRNARVGERREQPTADEERQRVARMKQLSSEIAEQGRMLQSDVDKAGADVVSVAAVRRAERVERAARELQHLLKGQ